MYVVAITRWGQPLQQEVGALAPLLGMAVYDAKLRLAAPLPVVFARESEVARARELLATVRGRGHGAVACELSFVQSSAEMASPRSYVFEPESFVASDPAWGQQSMPYADIAALIQARAQVIEQSSAITKEKKLSMGRAVLSGGMMMRKTNTTEQRNMTEEHEQVLYLVRKDGRDPMFLRAGRLRHRGLGDRAGRTSLANFATLIAVLRERAPQALFDDRLVRQRRKVDLTSISGTATDRTAASSNASANDLAAHLIAVAHLQGQG